MDNDGILAWLAAKANWKRPGIRHENLTHCLNCNHELGAEDLYCPSCGQKVHDSKLTVWSLISEFFAGLFNLENGFYRSMRYIAWPGYLTTEFMQGRRKKYLNPIRLFVVSLIIHLAVINYFGEFDGLMELSSDQIEKIGEQHLYNRYAAIRDSAEVSDHSIYQQLDSTIFRNYLQGGGELFEGREFFNVFGIDFKALKLERKDVFEMPLDDLVEKYEISGWQKKLVFSQAIRAWRDPVGAVRQAIGAVLWGVLLAIFLTGLLMKLLYIRKKRYYVEHLILLFHIHAFSFIVTTVGMLFAFLGDESHKGSWLLVTYGIAAIYFFLAIKVYYKQGLIKSLVKFFMVGVFYLIILFSAIAFSAVVSLLFFK